MLFRSPYFLNLNTEYIMRNTGLDEAQARIQIARRNFNNLRYADDTTLMAESEELKSLLRKVKKESEKNSHYSHLVVGTPLQIFKQLVLE